MIESDVATWGRLNAFPDSGSRFSDISTIWVVKNRVDVQGFFFEPSGSMRIAHCQSSAIGIVTPPVRWQRGRRDPNLLDRASGQAPQKPPSPGALTAFLRKTQPFPIDQDLQRKYACQCNIA